MTDSPQATLVLGGTGRTGSLVARTLIERGLKARTASRREADVLFDWDDPATYAPALQGVDRVYLVTPVLRVTYAGAVSDFLDLAAGAGVRHVTYLSTYGADQAPPEVDIRAVELDLARRGAFTYSLLRPAWVMQNFSDQHLPVIDGAITVPTRGGVEALVDAADIAAVAVETLADPDAHAGAQYAPTGPQALTVSQVADIIADVSGGPVTHNDIDADAWIERRDRGRHRTRRLRRDAQLADRDHQLRQRLPAQSRRREGHRPTAGHLPGLRPPERARMGAPGGQVTTPIDELGDYTALDPFFRLTEQGLAGLVDSGQFFDLLAEDVVFDYVITVPGYPRRVEGRRAVAELYRGYGSTMVLSSADELAVHRDREASVTVLEYAVHGQAVRTGQAYHNHFVSVITVKDRKVTYWRDYLDPVAVFNAIGWPAHHK